jgi:hypothetical protein
VTEEAIGVGTGSAIHAAIKHAAAKAEAKAKADVVNKAEVKGKADVVNKAEVKAAAKAAKIKAAGDAEAQAAFHDIKEYGKEQAKAQKEAAAAIKEAKTEGENLGKLQVKAKAEAAAAIKKAESQGKKLGEKKAAKAKAKAKAKANAPRDPGVVAKAYFSNSLKHSTTTLHEAHKLGYDTEIPQESVEEKLAYKYLEKKKHFIDTLSKADLKEGKAKPPKVDFNSIGDEAAAEALKAAEEQLVHTATAAGVHAGMKLAHETLSKNPKEVAEAIDAKLRKLKHHPAVFSEKRVAQAAAQAAQDAARNALKTTQHDDRIELQKIIAEESKGQVVALSSKALLDKGHTAWAKAVLKKPAEETTKKVISKVMKAEADEAAKSTPHEEAKAAIKEARDYGKYLGKEQVKASAQAKEAIKSVKAAAQKDASEIATKAANKTTKNDAQKTTTNDAAKAADMNTVEGLVEDSFSKAFGDTSA